jgi:hypothetical protein
VFKSGGPEIFGGLVIAAIWAVPVAAALRAPGTLHRLRSCNE